MEKLRGLGPARCRELAEAGYKTAQELIWHIPTRYEDRRRIVPIVEARTAGTFTITGTVRGLRRIRTRRGGGLVRGLVQDDSGALAVLWFNRPYLPNQIVEDEQYLLSGTVKVGRSGLEMVNPSCERAGSQVHGGRVVPVYSPIGKVGPALVRRLIDQLIEECSPEQLFEEPLPRSLLQRHQLPEIGPALAALHRPSEADDVDELNEHRSVAHGRLIYGEFLVLQVELALLRARQVELPKSHSYRVDDDLRAIAREMLPFRLTGAQKRVVREIVTDLRDPHPMLRLLQGDVGSGKTIVAALALVVALESGLQAAFMAPTELLAEQHLEGLRRWLGDRYRIGLFTGSASQMTNKKRDLAKGGIQLAVGTHALIQQSVRFDRLGLAIIDEQHRFGVAQRQVLQEKGDRPDMLVMTATPIPRSLALTAYGDLAISVIDELPPGRTPIESRLVAEGDRRRMYDWVSKQLAEGARAYVVFPLIEESEKIEAGSIEARGTEVQSWLSEYRSTVLHGRTPPEERDEIMARFRSGEVTVLIATTVIEVGVDVPEASIMVIESAERFGLAQLHQLRGRVGRGARASYCFAVHGNLSENGRRRLEVFSRSQDGFRIAEADLEIRGPGELLGTRQSGLPQFRVGDLIRDHRWLSRAREDARDCLERRHEPEMERWIESVERQVGSRYDRFSGG